VSLGCGPITRARPLPSDAAARYQKESGKAIDNFAAEQSLGFPDLLGGKIAEQREFEHLSLKSLDHKN